MSIYNTPVLPVKKPDGFYGLVQDLRAINQITQNRHLVVPNPYPLLSTTPYDHKRFSAVDKDAFWACPWLRRAEMCLPSNGKTPWQVENSSAGGWSFPKDLQNFPILLGQILEQILVNLNHHHYRTSPICGWSIDLPGQKGPTHQSNYRFPNCPGTRRIKTPGQDYNVWRGTLSTWVTWLVKRKGS